jgi:S-adenosylmethionine:tRNA ribosyltransferase-isomerase
LEEVGELPLPPYLRRPPESADSERYQTVFAKEPGSVAAPTAGLHLTEEMLSRLQDKGVLIGELTLQIGLGTFSPVKVEDLDQHPMHSETLDVGQSLVELVGRARQEQRRVVAIGTTVVRALEAAADPEREGYIHAMRGKTDLLIQPGYRFKVVDSLLTNFHMPKSTLLALVSAFAGYERVMSAYRRALAEDYAFLSYGDAMWIAERRC